jgi:hypothetical protein
VLNLGRDNKRCQNTEPLFEPGSLTINADRFVRILRAVLDEFRVRLEAADWDSLDWKNVRIKMKALMVPLP